MDLSQQLAPDVATFSCKPGMQQALENLKRIFGIMFVANGFLSAILAGCARGGAEIESSSLMRWYGCWHDGGLLRLGALRSWPPIPGDSASGGERIKNIVS
jgi:hypothetical protein